MDKVTKKFYWAKRQNVKLKRVDHNLFDMMEEEPLSKYLKNIFEDNAIDGIIAREASCLPRLIFWAKKISTPEVQYMVDVVPPLGKYEAFIAIQTLEIDTNGNMLWSVPEDIEPEGFADWFSREQSAIFRHIKGLVGQKLHLVLQDVTDDLAYYSLVKTDQLDDSSNAIVVLYIASLLLAYEEKYGEMLDQGEIDWHISKGELQIVTSATGLTWHEMNLIKEIFKKSGILGSGEECLAEELDFE